MNVFVTGASGFIGRNLIPRLLDSGHSVSAWGQTERSALGRSHANLLWSWGNLGEISGETESRLRQALEVCQVVVHLAAKTSENPSRPEAANRVNIEGTRKLLELAKQAGARKFIFMSSQSAKIKNSGDYGTSKKIAESIVLDSGMDAVILRPAIIYGKGSSGVFGKFVQTVEKLPILPIPSSPVKFQPVFVGDVAQCILAALEKNFPTKISDVAGPDAVTFPELIRLVADAKGLKRIIIPFPMSLALLGAKILAILPRPPITVDNIIGLSQETPLDLRPMREELGVNPVSLREGLRQSLT